MMRQEKAEGGVTVVILDSRFDAESAPFVEEKLKKVIADGANKVVIDLAGVEYLSSAGLRALLIAQKLLFAKGQDLRLAAVRPDVEEVFDVAGLTSLFKIFATREEAVRSF